MEVAQEEEMEEEVVAQEDLDENMEVEEVLAGEVGDSLVIRRALNSQALEVDTQ